MSRTAWLRHNVRRIGARQRIVGAMVVALALAAPTAVPAAADTQTRAGAPAAQPTPSVKDVTTLTPRKLKVKDQTKQTFRPAKATWPAAVTGTATLAAPPTGAKQGTKSPAAGTPVWARTVSPAKGAYQGPNGVSVRVLPHQDATKLGVSGVVLAAQPTAGGSGKVQLGLDYSTFAQAYGGNYADRIHLVKLPACALTTPQRTACRTQTPLPTDRDPAARELTTTLTLQGSPPQTSPSKASASADTAAVPASYSASPTSGTASSGELVVLAATASSTTEGGAAGSYDATTLAPSGSWTGGNSSGSFTYNYPISLAPSSGLLKPSVGLAYDSGSVDGQTSSTQAQSSWVGDGWATPDSAIEQSFTSCSDSPEGTASPVSSGDKCYDGPILSLALGGSSTALVKNDSDGTWKLAQDNGSTVKHVTNANNGSGTYNTDYWIVTDRSGTQYYFGRNQLPGWASGKATTKSVDTAPVYSAHSGDPCYSSSGFSASVCTMAYKWHLDYVVDTHANAMAYYYAQDTNYYGEENGAHNVSYVRDSHLSRIDYGFRDGGAYGTVPDQVVFTTAARCTLTTCDPLSASTAASQYPDVPFDFVCASGATCAAQSPSFFSTVRLASIKIQQYSVAAAKYQAIDTYTLHQSEPATGDGTSPTLWLASITREGNDTTAGGSTSPITLPDVKFAGVDLKNRVDTSNFPGLYRYRISGITNELGGLTTVSYDLPDACTTTYVASADPKTNTKSCYPVSWTPKDYLNPVTDWFQKYAVTQVLETDSTGGALAKQTNYLYNGGAAWHHDDNEVVKAKYRTWGQFRGYASVETRSGNGSNDSQTKSVTSYYRGMDDDWLSSSSRRTVNVTDSQGGVHTDSNQLAGNALETTAYTGVGGSVDNSTVTSYWISAPTATRARTGMPTLTAHATNTAENWSRQAITNGGTTTWRVTETDNTYDATVTDDNFGLLTYSYTHTVPAVAAYDQCTAITYAKANTTANLVGLTAAQETDSVACAGFSQNTPATVPKTLNTLTAPTSVTRPDQVVSATRTHYDDTAFATAFPQATAPTKGEITMTRQASGYSGGTFTWQTQTRATYDAYGRPADSYDAGGNKTTAAYIVDSAGLTTGTTITNAKNQTAKTTSDPTRGLILTTTDPNGIATAVHYDALGRTTEVWQHSRPTTAAADTKYTYTVSQTSQSGTTTDTLNDSLGYITSYSLIDSLGRPRQTQAPTPQGGRMIAESFYDSHGWVWKQNNAYWDPDSLPALSPASAQDSQIPSQDRFTFDGLGRVVVGSSEQYSVLKEQTTTVYSGDATTVIPPAGATVKTTRTDPLGRTSEVDSYSARPMLSTPLNTFTGLFSVSGGTFNAITYGYDGHNKQNTVTAKGSTWTTVYDLLGRATTKTDPDAGITSMVYDAAGHLTQTTDARGKSVSYTYDALNRQTGQYASTVAAQAPGASGNQTAAWTYDNDNAVSGVTNPIGQRTTATSYNAGNTYTTQQLAFNTFGESLGESITIPAVHGALGGKTYTFRHTYSPDTGLLYTDNYPLGGGLPNEITTHTYRAGLDLPASLSTTSYGYAQNTTYTAYGQVLQETLGMGTNLAYITNAYDPHTGALTDQLVTRSATAVPSKVDDQNYKYDAAGNITRQVTTRLGAATAPETQCYQYDELDRLTQAWTATDSCDATPTASAHAQIGDPLTGGTAYWTSWDFDVLGQRQHQIEHSTTGGSDTTTSYTYDYNGNSTPQPHALASTQASGASTATTSYTYDKSGNTTTRNTLASGNQTLTWNDAGQLTQVSGGKTGTTSYIYDADGSVLLQTDPTSTTLYLPGEQLTLTGTTTTGVRYLPLPGGGTAVRTGTGTNYKFQISDPHGTSSLYLDNTAQTPTWRQFTPYGAPRGTTVSWIDNRGFLNAPDNTNTGLTQLGARQYDPTLGRFISLDPLFEATDDQQLAGYSYAASNPITKSDPSGLCAGPDCPTRNCPSCLNSTPGNKASTDAAMSDYVGSGSTPSNSKTVIHQMYVASTTPSSNDATRLGSAYHQFGSNQLSSTAGGYWSPQTNVFGQPETVCYGRLACNHAYAYFLEHPDDVAGAKEIAATYCIANPECEKDARIWERTFELGGEFVETVAAAGGARIGPKTGASGAVKSACSFSPDTQVLMEGDKTKPIGKIEPGDKVEAADQKSGKHVGSRKVQYVLINHDYDLLDLTIRNEDGKTATLHTTASHPFWDDSARTWVPAGKLHRGDILNTSTDHHAYVVSKNPTPGDGNRWNLTVEDLHTYYVLAGQTPVLVHNSNCDLPEGYTSSPALKGDPYHPDSVAARSAQNRELYAGTVGDRAGALGYRTRIPAQKAPFNSHGQVVFSNGKNYITPDVDGHNVSDGWKMFNRKGQRIGTYDPDLNYLKE
ncbi:RHS repeat-associated protein [Streptomyces sp. 3330]|uniref:polymorphic toxin-type HINT domain-containing protein n=1 Tax=Streptomyces sp. 3330 TaxID=2817755 RepID=UPI002860968D|nr:polymorphic toxin-type HINT domain-containing protein [Streptomyces sp. 3330]MDR6980449.1 RHS repeat-associated protein [Streptomyces sp. 3330]